MSNFRRSPNIPFHFIPSRAFSFASGPQNNPLQVLTALVKTQEEQIATLLDALKVSNPIDVNNSWTRLHNSNNRSTHVATYAELKAKAEKFAAEAEAQRVKELDAVIADMKAKMVEYGVTPEDLGIRASTAPNPSLSTFGPFPNLAGR